MLELKAAAAILLVYVDLKAAQHFKHEASCLELFTCSDKTNISNRKLLSGLFDM